MANSKFSVKGLRSMAEELLRLRAAVERYEQLEPLVLAGLQELKFNQVTTDLGQVILTNQVSVPANVAIRELGANLASETIIYNRVVSNGIIRAFVKAGKITPGQRAALLAGAEKKPVIRLKPAKPSK